MLRTNTPGSSEWRPIRTRSPSTAPPVNGLLGSTATTATVRLRAADRRHQLIDERALAAAGRARHANDERAAAVTVQLADQLAGGGSAVFHQGDRPRHRARIGRSVRERSARQETGPSQTS